MMTRLARSIVARYPAAWRERYEDEVLALLAEGCVTSRDVVDLARGLLVERSRSVIEPGERPALTATVYWLLLMGLRFLPGVAAVAVTMAAGLWLNQTFGPAPTWTGVVGLTSSLLGVALYAWWYWPATKAGIPSNDRMPMPRVQRSLVLIGMFGGLVLITWIDPPDGAWQTGIWFYLLPGYIASQIRPRFSRSREILWAFGALSTVNSQLKWAHRELNRCRDLRAQGQWAPLIDAEVAVKVLQEERGEIHEVLKRCGYRARFR
jgi:hypothetical protein